MHPNSLQSLEQQRSGIAAQIASLGDLRSGSITPTRGRCGKPSCHCHRRDDPGHGPNLRLTYKLHGKTVTESLPDQAAVRKAQSEIAEFRKLENLHRRFVDVNAQICRLRPVDETLTAQEKKRPKSSSKRSPRK